jgi:hypothetical protein
MDNNHQSINPISNIWAITEIEQLTFEEEHSMTV